MEIKKTSWHYKLYKLIRSGFHPPTSNLCKYFWWIVFGVVLFAFLGMAAGVVLIGIGTLFYTFPLYAFSALGVLLLVIALFVIRSIRPDGPKAEPGLVRLYLKAKKDRICPLVTFVS